MADGEVGRKPTAGVVGHVAGQLKSHMWGTKSERGAEACVERATEVTDKEPAEDFRQLG